jgi:hypothetical protein
MTTRAQSAWNKIAVITLCDVSRKVNPAPVTNVVIQKVAFLTELEGRRQGIKTGYYRFFKYKHGPFSNALSWDIADLEKGRFIDSESGELLDRGRYLLDYVRSELDSSPLTNDVMRVIHKISESWKSRRGWDIVDAIYQLRVPVDALQGQNMFVRDIPLKTDILIPEWSPAQDYSPFSARVVEDIEEELNISPSALDPSSEEFSSSVTDAYHRALAM